MAKLYDPELVDPTVTQEEIERALDGTPTTFPGVFDVEQDSFDDVLRTLVTVVPATVPERCANAKQLRDDHVHVGIGMCLATVRGPILGLPAVFPTAADAGDHSDPFHKMTSPGTTKPRRGSIGFAWNGGDGHVWLELGGGIVSTTDFHELGFEGVALRSRMLEWCGATRWGIGEKVNGFYVGPSPDKTKPEPKPEPEPEVFSLEDRLAIVRRRRRHADDAGHDRREARFRLWEAELERRIKAAK